MRRVSVSLALLLCATALTAALSAQAEVTQRGTLRVTVAGKLRPERLPRRGRAPVAVTVGGRISTTDDTLPPQLKRLRIELNRHGRLDRSGLPICPFDSIQPGSSAHALAACSAALIGRGSFSAAITLAGSEPLATEGRLLVFNGVRGGKPVLFGHIYAARPFATSFVIVFALRRLTSGTYGTLLDAPMPKAMDSWGRLTGLTMTLSRRYRHRGAAHSYISSGCPTPAGVPNAVFRLARTSFLFAGGEHLDSTLTADCRVKR